jgi:hypothetical protein
MLLLVMSEDQIAVWRIHKMEWGSLAGGASVDYDDPPLNQMPRSAGRFAVQG